MEGEGEEGRGGRSRKIEERDGGEGGRRGRGVTWIIGYHSNSEICHSFTHRTMKLCSMYYIWNYICGGNENILMHLKNY